MMDGVHILNTISNNVRGWGTHSVGGWILAIIALIIVVIGIVLTICNKDSDFLALLFVAGIPLIFSAIMFSEAAIVGTYNTYEVIIDEDVKFVELMEKYDIVEQRNDLFVIKEKNAT